jgi:Tfp pilus assembly protein PilF
VRFLIADDDEGRGRGSEMLVEAHRVVPDDDEVCVLVGHLYARTGSSSKGAEMYKRALNLNPANSEAVRALEPLA